MTLGEFVSNYRAEHGMSKRTFAAFVGMSVQQISNIEKGTGNDGKPMSSTMKTYKKIADAIGMSEQEFLNLLNDNMRVNPSDSSAQDDFDGDILALREEIRNNYALRVLLDSTGNATEADLLEAAAVIMRRKEERGAET